jgi:hypothetical protein
MIAPRTTQVAPAEWWYDVGGEDESSELERPDLLELETAAREAPEDQGADDEVARASEELRADEG